MSSVPPPWTAYRTTDAALASALRLSAGVQISTVVEEKHPDLQVTRHLLCGSAVRALVDGSRTVECVVVASRGVTSTVGQIGSVGRAVVEQASSTVVVVRA